MPEGGSYFLILVGHALYHFLICVPLEVISSFAWFLPFRLVDVLARLSTSERDVLATMKVAHAIYLFPVWIVCLSIAAGGWLDGREGWTGWWEAVVTGLGLSMALVASMLVSQRKSFFPGYWKLARLRFLHPRAWKEVREEWQSFSETVLSTIERTQRNRQHGHGSVDYEAGSIPLRKVRDL